MKPNFSGWATKNDLKCSDGRTIRAGAFKHMDKKKVPLVWRHNHDEPEMVLGHAILEARPEGVYTYGYFNETERGQLSKMQVEHGDLDSLSIFANNLTQRGGDVFHGDIKELSLVMAGANPGALIDQVYIQHGDDLTPIDSEAIIYTGLHLEHEDIQETKMPDENTDETVEDVYNTMTEKQQMVVQAIVAEAVENSKNDDSNDNNDSLDHDGMTTTEFLTHIDNKIQEGFENMGRNVFEQNDSGANKIGATLSHDQLHAVMTAANDDNAKLSKTLLAHAGTFGINDIEVLFPDARSIEDDPQFLARRMEWVQIVLNGVKHSPIARIKSVVADITADEARAKGYVKGNEKKEEVFGLLKRTTGPTTIYKKQKLDRDDIIDIVDLNVVAWLKAEMRIMLDEEIARAILVGDGRSNSNPDKIKDPAGSNDGVGVRSIANDHPMYAHEVVLPTNVQPEATIESITRSRTHYRGSGTPIMFTTDSALIDMLLLKDGMKRRLYNTEEELAAVLRVTKIVPVEVLEDYPDILAIIVNLSDYTVGADKGGSLTFFEDFDIDFNQEKYLYETRISGALTKPKSAIIIRRAQGTLATPVSPSFDGEENEITIPTTTGVDYYIDGEIVTGTIVIEEDTEVSAEPKANYFFPGNITTHWTFVYTGA